MKRSGLARRRRFLLLGLFAAVAIAGCDRAVDTATLIDRATAFRAEGDVESALIELRNAVQQAPGNQTARALLAAVFVDKAAGFRAANDLHGSIGALESALRWHAGDKLTRAELVQDYLDMAARMAAKGDHATRIAALKGAVATAPKHGEARLRLGAAYLEANAAEDAAKEFQRAEQNGIERFRLVAPLGEAWLRLAEYERLLGTFHPDDPMLADDRPLVYALRGRALAGIGDIAGSRAAFWHALRADPANVAALVGLARLAIDSGDLATAEARLTAAAAHTPGSPRVLALQAELEQGLSNYGKAMTAYRALLQIEPGNMSARLGLALVEILGGNLERAIAEIEPRLAQLPADPNANYLRGLAAYLLRDYPTAARHADVALVGAPGHLPTKLLRGATAAAARDPETAVLYLDDVVAADPRHRTARRLLGQALLQVGQADAALAVLRPLDGLNVDDTALIGVIGDAAIGAGDLLLGENYYRRLAALQPDRADLRVRLGAVQAARGRVEEGVYDIEAALGTDPTFASAHAALTMAHLQANDHAAALASANRLIEHAPGSATGHMLAGYASLRTGQPDRARRQLGEALSIDPTNGQAARLLASLLVGSDTDAARAHLEAALAAAPHDVDLLLSLAEFELGANDAAAAEVRFEQLVAVAPAALAPRIALARLYLLRGAPRQALAVTEDRLADHAGNLALLDVVGRCAVERRRLLAGANPARQLSLQPVAIGAGDGGNDIGLKHSDVTRPPRAAQRPCGLQRE